MGITILPSSSMWRMIPVLVTPRGDWVTVLIACLAGMGSKPAALSVRALD
jgi:hypothetical protein